MEFFGKHHGRIEAIVGSMFSGKTEELIRRIRRAQFARQKVQVFKPKVDDRNSNDEVASHNDIRFPSMVIEKAEDILEHVEDSTRVVGIDEVQFFDKGIIDVMQKLADRGVRVIVAGLDTDWSGKPFEPVPTIMAIAETVSKQNAICVVCGDPASRTQRTVESDKEVLVGASKIYEARCRACFDPFFKMGRPTASVLDEKETQNNN